jgi:TolB protein
MTLLQKWSLPAAMLVALVAGIGACGNDVEGVNDGPPSEGPPSEGPPSEGPPSRLSNQIVFSSDRSGRMQLYAIRPDGTGLIKLSRGATPEYWAAVSPDGRRLAFYGEEAEYGPLILARDVDGTNQDTLVDNYLGACAHNGFAWNPAGDHLAFRTGKCSWLRFFPLYLVGGDGTDLVRIDDGLYSGGAGSWSPDGQNLVFTQVHWLKGDSELYVWAAGTGEIAQLTPGDSGRVSGEAWQPTGSLIAFSDLAFPSGRDTPGWSDTLRAIYVVGLDGADPVKLLDNAKWPTWSPDGSRLAFLRDGDLWVANADGSDPHNLTQGQTPYELVGDVDGDVDWAPDGSALVFGSESESDPEIYVVHADGTGLANLTHNAARDVHPVWVGNTSP